MLNCCFCGKTQDEVDQIIESKASTICDECVKLCSQIIAEKDRKKHFKSEVEK